MGGAIALQVAHQFPEISQRLVLVASGGLGTDAHPLVRAASAPGAEFVLPLVMNQRVIWAMNLARRAWKRRGRAPVGLLSDSAMRNYGALSTRAGRRIFLATVRSVIDRSGQRVTAVGRLHLTSHLPTLLISSEYDPAIPRSHAEAAHAELLGSRLEILPGRSHRPHQQDPERFAEVLADFVRSTAPASEPPAWRTVSRAPVG